MITLKRKLIVLVAMFFLLVIGIYVYRSTYNNKIPKSAKLVFIQKNKCPITG